MKLRTLQTLKVNSAYKSLLSKNMNRQLKKDMEEQVGGALTGNYGKMTVFKSFMAIVILLLGVIDV